MTQIQSIYIYGSRARKAHSNQSDFDFLVITNNTVSEREKLKIQQTIVNDYVDKDNISTDKNTLIDISFYTTHQIDNMLSIGHLLLWHIKLEGQLLEGNPIHHLDSLVEYTKYQENILMYRNIYLKYKFKILSEPLSLFDFQLLGRIARNILMYLSNKFGDKQFDKFNVFDEYEKNNNISRTDRDIYLSLMHLKDFYNRGGTPAELLFNTNRYLEFMDSLLENALLRFQLNDDLTLTYKIMSNTIDTNFIEQFSLDLSLERGIYNTMCSIRGNRWSSLIYFYENKINHPAYVFGIKLLEDNKKLNQENGGYQGQYSSTIDIRKYNTTNSFLRDGIFQLADVMSQEQNIPIIKSIGKHIQKHKKHSDYTFIDNFNYFITHYSKFNNQ